MKIKEYKQNISKYYIVLNREVINSIQLFITMKPLIKNANIR